MILPFHDYFAHFDQFFHPTSAIRAPLDEWRDPQILPAPPKTR
jgi:hypothetical protein